MPRLRTILGLTALGLCLALGYFVSRPAETIEGTRIESIVAVAERPELIGAATSGYGRYVQIEFSAPARLAEVIEEVDAFYPKVGFCQPSDKSRIIALGPYLADGREMPLRESDIKLDDQGRVRYRFFVVPAHPMPNVKYASGFDQKPYDLISNQRLLCVRLESSGFEFERIQTNTIEIPASAIIKVLDQDAS